MCERSKEGFRKKDEAKEQKKRERRKGKNRKERENKYFDFPFVRQYWICVKRKSAEYAG